LRNRYEALESEIIQIEKILSGIPKDSVIERMSFVDRLETAKSELSELSPTRTPERTRLTFRGAPVFGSYGIAADFGGNAANAFADAYAAIIAGLNSTLRYKGPIPDKTKNQLLITGTALGSFGFEFELPDTDLFQGEDNAEFALETFKKLLKVSAEGSDDEVTELVDIIHPRAVRKVADFLTYLSQQQAWCGIEFKDDFFRFRDVDQLKRSVERLKEENIVEDNYEYFGEFQGVLPQSRTFEFRTSDAGEIIKGKIHGTIDDPDVINREWLHTPCHVTLNFVQVGQATPRYTLVDLSKIKPAKN